MKQQSRSSLPGQRWLLRSSILSISFLLNIEKVVSFEVSGQYLLGVKLIDPIIGLVLFDVQKIKLSLQNCLKFCLKFQGCRIYLYLYICICIHKSANYREWISMKTELLPWMNF